jgi:FtsZ-binding cell division protein ZapB
MTGDKLYLLTEAAELTGATVETIRQRIKRRKLQAVKGNDGRVRVRLTDADIAALKTGQSTSQPTGQSTGQPVEDSRVIKALEAHVQTLREQLEQQRTDHQTERQALRDENNRLRDGLSIERDHARDLAGRLDTAHRAHGDEAARLRQKIAALRTELARSWWRRLIGR